MERALETLEIIAAELERLRVLKEHELGVRVQEAPDGNGPYVPADRRSVGRIFEEE